MYAKKIFLLLLAAFLGASPAVLAREATVTGTGEDRAAAMQNVARSAVEEVVGVYVDSRTLVKESQLAMDEIYTHSRGFVQKITVLEEGKSDSGYTIKALVDVNDAPNAALMDQLTMLMLLNDPAIYVSVKRGGTDRDTSAENAFNERLLEIGFEKVQAKKDNPDFLVRGKLTTSSQEISVPNAKRESTATGLFSGRARLNVTVVAAKDNQVVGNFSLQGSGVGPSADSAENKAADKTISEAAARLEELFKKVGSKVRTVKSTVMQGGEDHEAD